MRTGIILLLSLLLTLLSGCATLGERDDTAGWSVERFHEEARRALDQNDFERAISLYEGLEARYPYHPLAQQAQIDTAYVYYRNDEPEAAIAAAERFIRLHPRHEHVAYAYYLRGLATFDEGSFLLNLFGEDPTQRDPLMARRSFDYFREVAERFPDSRYAQDAIQRMLHLRNRLAEHELHVARYYQNRSAWLAAANRARFVVEHYQQSPAVFDALEIMVSAYTEMGLDDLAEDARRVLRMSQAKE